MIQLARVTEKQRANWARVRNYLSDAEFAEMTADAQAVVDEMNDLNRQVVSYREKIGAQCADAVPMPLLKRMTEVVIAQAEREREIRYEWRGLFPTTPYPWQATTIRIPVWSGEGVANWYYGGGNHPNVSVGMRYIEISMRSFSLAYVMDWLSTQEETWAGLQTETEKVQRVYDGLDEFASKVLYEGASEAGFDAFIGHANIGSGAVPYGDWDANDSVATEIHDDIIYAVNQVYAQNDGDETFNNKRVTVWLSPVMYRIAATRIMNTYTNQKILEVVLGDPRIAAVRSVAKLATTAGGANDYIIVGVFDESEITVPVGADAMQMPPQMGGHFIEQPFFTKLGGIFVKHPLSFWRGTGLHATGG